jgi:SWI/SNF-related matrix-associated actin-dependent regulator of chromatin subfamily D
MQQTMPKRPMASYGPPTRSSKIALPEALERSIPAADHYNRLLATERKLDAAISRKRFDLQESLNRPNKVKRTLRIWCSNTCQDQAWQVMDDGINIELNHFDFENSAIPGWTLRLEGKVLESDQLNQGEHSLPTPQFTDLLRTVVVEAAAPLADDAYSEGPLFEWHKTPQTIGQAPLPSYPGMEFKRNGDMELDLKIMISLDFLPEKYKLSENLARLLDIQVETRPGIITALWHYVRLHKLQDSDEKRLIQCDQSLQDVFGVERIFFPKIPEMLNKFLEPVDPIVLEYRVRVDKAVHYAVPWDIEIELDNPMRSQMAAALKNLSATAAGSMTHLDEDLASLITAIEHSVSKQEFMTSFSTDPSLFLQDWLDSQDHDLNVIMGEVKHVDGEQARRAAFYRDVASREWLHESVFRYLATK